MATSTWAHNTLLRCWTSSFLSRPGISTLVLSIAYSTRISHSSLLATHDSNDHAPPNPPPTDVSLLSPASHQAKRYVPCFCLRY